MGDPRRTEVVLDVTIAASLTVVLTLLTAGGDLTARRLASVLGVYAFAGLIYRCIGYAHDMDTLHWALTILLASSALIVAAGTYLAQISPSDAVIWALVAHRAVMLALIAAWPWAIRRFAGFHHIDGRRTVTLTTDPQRTQETP